MLILEGTYPFNGGGVSTWAHMLCNKVKNVNYTLYSINADFEQKSKYELSENVKNVIQVPLWSPMEPSELLSYGKKYYATVNRKEQDDNSAIIEEFIPIFERLLFNIYADNADIEDIDDTIFDMWFFFQNHDYKKTMKSVEVWKSFYKTVSKVIVRDNHYGATLYDFTVGMRWIYRFLIPISIDVPKVDISHLTLSGFPVIPALVLKYKYGTPIIVTEHGVFIRERLIAINSSEYSFFLKNLLIKFSECITKLVYYKSDLILSVNKFNISWEKKYGANPNKIEVIYNGIDPDLFAPSGKPAHLEGVPTVVAAARIFELKDIITMIRSCEVVKNTIPNVKFLVYGDNTAVPEYTKECLNLIKELGLENNFSLAGYHNKPHQLFCEGDVSILTSISEGFPYTVLESMSCGIPVVATDVGGVTEALDDKCGFICKPKDYKALGESVITLLQDEVLRKQMGINARKKVVDNFTIEKFINEYEIAYESILNKKAQEPIFLHSDLPHEETMEAS
ncbi:GT4 family glycosyltransferase PelF [Flavobacterium psychrotolerans]|nr:GT4 family glycosyltransferase PelF [Flavobacterium psychrotolerans]